MGAILKKKSNIYSLYGYTFSAPESDENTDNLCRDPQLSRNQWPWICKCIPKNIMEKFTKNLVLMREMLFVNTVAVSCGYDT